MDQKWGKGQIFPRTTTNRWKHKQVIIMGDLNGRVGNRNEGVEECVGKQGENIKKFKRR